MANESIQEELNSLVTELRNIRAQREQLEAEEESIKDLIKEYLSENARTELDGPDYRITWSYCVKETLDVKTLRAEEPTIAARYLRTSKYRQFRLSERGAHKKEASK